MYNIYMSLPLSLAHVCSLTQVPDTELLKSFGIFWVIEVSFVLMR